MPIKKVKKEDREKIEKAEVAEMVLGLLLTLKADYEKDVLESLKRSPVSDLVRVQAEYNAYNKVEKLLRQKINEGALASNRAKKTMEVE